jgi:preprotein translocase, SecE subunit, bacterial
MAGQETTQNKGVISNIPKNLRETKGEFRKITWPTRREMVAYTVVVIFTVVLMATIIWGIDLVLNFIIRLILRK